LPVSPQQHAAAVPVRQAAQGTTRLAELQYLLRYGGLKQACPLSWARERLLGRPASTAYGRA
jgi:hypothetical protein